MNSLETPIAVIDAEPFERNLARMAEFARTSGVRLRPHAKSHKCSETAAIRAEPSLKGVSAMDAKHVILRRWVGRIRTADEADYVAYVKRTGGTDYAETPGNRGFQIAMRALGEGVSEVTTLSWWDSMEAIKGFAGDKPEVARYYPDDDRFLLDRPPNVDHYRVFVSDVKLAV